MNPAIKILVVSSILLSFFSCASDSSKKEADQKRDAENRALAESFKRLEQIKQENANSRVAVPKKRTQESPKNQTSSLVSNKQFTDQNSAKKDYSIVGTWECNTNENNQDCYFLWKVSSNKSFKLYTNCESNEGLIIGTWDYEDDILTTIISNENIGTSKIFWKDGDNFILTILNYGDIKSKGLKRYYNRTTKLIPSNVKVTQSNTSTNSNNRGTSRCTTCEGSGLVRCSDLDGVLYRTNCLTQNELTNCWSNPNPHLKVTCCKCNGTGLVK